MKPRRGEERGRWWLLLAPPSGEPQVWCAAAARWHTSTGRWGTLTAGGGVWGAAARTWGRPRGRHCPWALQWAGFSSHLQDASKGGSGCAARLLHASEGSFGTGCPTQVRVAASGAAIPAALAQPLAALVTWFPAPWQGQGPLVLAGEWWEHPRALRLGTGTVPAHRGLRDEAGCGSRSWFWGGAGE